VPLHTTAPQKPSKRTTGESKWRRCPKCWRECPWSSDLGRHQQTAAHESPRTTKLYDRTSDQITLDEIERIAV